MSELVRMGDLSALKITLPNVDVSEEAVDERIRMVLRDKAVKAPSQEAIEVGDNVYISFEGKTTDGQDFKGSHGTNMAGEVGSEDFIKEFNKALPGHKAGDQLTIEVETEEDFHISEAAGLSLVFDVRIDRVMKDVLPNLDTFFIQSLNLQGISTVEDFRAFAERALRMDKFKDNEVLARNRLINEVVAKGDYEISEEEVHEESERLVQIFNDKLLYEGLILDEYLEKKGMTREELAHSYEEDAKNQIKIRLVFKHLEDFFGIVISDEDIEKEVEALREEYEFEIGELIQMSPKHKEKFVSDVTRRRIVERLMERTEIAYESV